MVEGGREDGGEKRLAVHWSGTGQVTNNRLGAYCRVTNAEGKYPEYISRRVEGWGTRTDSTETAYICRSQRVGEYRCFPKILHIMLWTVEFGCRGGSTSLRRQNQLRSVESRVGRGGGSPQFHRSCFHLWTRGCGSHFAPRYSLGLPPRRAKAGLSTIQFYRCGLCLWNMVVVSADKKQQGPT